MPLDKFGRHFHSQRRIRYNVLKAEGKLYFCVPIIIPCVKSQSKYTFPLASAIVFDAFKISEVDSFVRLFINDVRVEKLEDLKKMTLKRGDVLDIIHTSDKVLYVQLLLKCPIQVEG